MALAAASAYHQCMSEDPFLVRCREDREEYRRRLADCESGVFQLRRLEVGRDPRDEMPEHIARLRRIIAELDALIADMERERA